MTKQVNTLKLLSRFKPCCPDYLQDKTAREAWEQCERGDWMLWAYARLYPERKRKLTLAKGLCANTVRHLMKDQRSIKAVDTAIAYGRGEATEEELKATVKEAYAASADAYAASADAYAASADANAALATARAAAYAARAAAYAPADAYAAYAAANAAADAAYYAAAYAAADDAYAAAKRRNQKQTADICRRYLSVDF